MRGADEDSFSVIEDTRLDLITLLRLIMRTSGGVLFREWRVLYFVGGLIEDGCLRGQRNNLSLFPPASSTELWETPFDIDGVSLVHAAALADYFEGAEIVRKSLVSPDQIDVRIQIDAPHLYIYTDDQGILSEVDAFLSRLPQE